MALFVCLLAYLSVGAFLAWNGLKHLDGHVFWLNVPVWRVFVGFAYVSLCWPPIGAYAVACAIWETDWRAAWEETKRKAESEEEELRDKSSG